MNRRWRPRCEDFLRLDVRKLRFGLDRPAWQYVAGTIAVSVGEDSVRVVHDRLDYFVAIERTQCNYGGSRPWFRCPSCGDRRAVLYGQVWGSAIACRRCLKLLYATECEDAFGRALLKVGKVERRICVPSAGIIGTAPLVGRPRGQHRRIYRRDIARLIAARYALCVAWKTAQVNS